MTKVGHEGLREGRYVFGRGTEKSLGKLGRWRGERGGGTQNRSLGRETMAQRKGKRIRSPL